MLDACRWVAATAARRAGKWFMRWLRHASRREAARSAASDRRSLHTFTRTAVAVAGLLALSPGGSAVVPFVIRKVGLDLRHG